MGSGIETVNELSGVPETMLWPLWNRAAEQRRPDKLIDDPLSAELVSRIEFDFRGTFSAPTVFHVIRARVCDDLVAEYVNNCEDQPIVVSLGDGLETQPWRVNDERIRWFSVDVEEAVAVRTRLLPDHEAVSHIACSVMDFRWLEELPKGAAPFFSAMGLLMYFEDRDVQALLAAIADRFPNAQIFFDTIPPYFSRRTLKGLKVTKQYTAPKMPWGISVDDVAAFLDEIPGVAAERVMTYAEPYPERTKLYALLSKITRLRRTLAGGLVLARTYYKTAAHYPA
ncbi:MAG: class I SAM-dependent methyltransferase [Pseudomonadota bacterium]